MAGVPIFSLHPHLVPFLVRDFQMVCKAHVPRGGENPIIWRTFERDVYNPHKSDIHRKLQNPELEYSSMKE